MFYSTYKNLSLKQVIRQFGKINIFFLFHVCREGLREKLDYFCYKLSCTLKEFIARKLKHSVSIFLKTLCYLQSHTNVNEAALISDHLFWLDSFPVTKNM